MTEDRDEALAMMGRLEPVILKLAADVGTLTADMAAVKADIVEVKARLIVVEGDLAHVKADLGDLKANHNELRNMLMEQAERVARLEGRIEEQSRILQLFVASRTSRPAAPRPPAGRGI